MESSSPVSDAAAIATKEEIEPAVAKRPTPIEGLDEEEKDGDSKQHPTLMSPYSLSRASMEYKSAMAERLEGSSSEDARGTNENIDTGEEDEINQRKSSDACCKKLSHGTKVLAYRFDEWFAQRKNQMIALCALTVLSVLILGVIFYAFEIVTDDSLHEPRWYGDPRGDTEKTIFDAFFDTWMFIVDPGSHSEQTKPLQRIASATFTIWGIVIMSSILAFVVDIFQAKMEQLKKGKSTVVESNHTLVFGWTARTPPFLVEIALANESEGGGTIVLLGHEPKEELELMFRNQVKASEMRPSGAMTNIVFRSGNPLRTTDLNRVSASTARSIVIFSNYNEEPDIADAEILRIILTLRSLSNGLEGHIVAEVRDVDNEPLIQLVGGDNVETVVSHDVIGRLMLMAARESGLAKVYDEILGFDGDEFYVEDWPEIYGEEFGHVCLRFPDAIPIGYKTPEGIVDLNPSKSHIMKPGEELIVIAEDDDTYKPEDAWQETNLGPTPKWTEREKTPEKILFTGWRRDVRDMLLHLDSLVSPNSELHMLAAVPVEDRAALLLEDGFSDDMLQNLKIVHHQGNSAIKRHLEPVPLSAYNVVLILADASRENDMMHSDSHSLATLLLIRDIQYKDKKKRGIRKLGSERAFKGVENWNTAKEHRCAIVCEILDSRTQETISASPSVSLSSDFVQSNRMIAQMISMVSEDRSVRNILDELLGAHGAAFHLKPSSRYTDRDCSFFAVMINANKMDEVAVGYQYPGSNGETVINPKDKHVTKSWRGIDIVVLAGHVLMQDKQKQAAERVINAFTKNKTMEPKTSSDTFVENAGASDESKAAVVVDEKVKELQKIVMDVQNKLHNLSSALK